MIKQTFYNLPEKKKNQIINASLVEFTEKQYAEATVSNICKLAKIPKGSFYQYFDEKIDCLLAVLDDVVKVKMDIINNVAKDIEKNGFFNTLKILNLKVLEMLDDYPRYFDLAKNIYGVKDINLVMFSRYAKETKDFYYKIIDYGIKSGEINPKLDKNLIIIYLENVQHSFADYIQGEILKNPHMKKDEYANYADAFFDVIFNGLSSKNL
ncbi:MAG: TetR/AcrR family transcriptional regulator [Candidatus Muirbacterium halophilum]|nr:TetR/AcrR family transcriptional regulator [Candidatus Muirbacterium halophilum]MCK9477088.1 TetR/AcrR family transcriptional regulator [Candidatus Muirbacterium halophilum]